MALAIESRYRDWVREINSATIMDKVDQLNKEFSSVIHDILYTDKPNKDPPRSLSTPGPSRIGYIPMSTPKSKPSSSLSSDAMIPKGASTAR